MAANKKKGSSISPYTRLLSVISIAMALLIIGIMGLVDTAGRQVRRQIHEQISFNVLFAPNMSTANQLRLCDSVAKLPFVHSATYISADSAASVIRKELGEDPVEVLGYNPLQAGMEIHIKEAYTNSDSLKVVDRTIRSWHGVDNLSYRQDLFETIQNNMRTLQLVLLVIAAALLIVCFIQINTTTRLMIYARRFQIRTMTLVGATPGFIRCPIVGKAMIDGVLGGLLATLILLGGIAGLKQYLPLPNLYNYLPLSGLTIWGAGLIVSGGLISSLTAYLAAQRYIRMDGSKMHLI